jgi:hypothetical protein
VPFPNRETLKSQGLSDEVIDQLTAEHEAAVAERDERIRSLSLESAEGRITKRIDELGLAAKPGAAKLYRRVALSEIDMPPMVLLADGDDAAREISTVALFEEFAQALLSSEDADESLRQQLGGQHLKLEAGPAPAGHTSETRRNAQVEWGTYTGPARDRSKPRQLANHNGGA